MLHPRFVAVRPVAGREELEVLDFTNRIRAAYGRAPLDWDPTLGLVARLHAGDMIAGRYFDHAGPEGTPLAERVARHGWGYASLGENLAGGHFTARAAVAGWLASPGHGHNLVRPQFDCVGVAVVEGGRWRRVWVQVFGGRA